MSTEIHFNKAWQRRIHERAMALEGKRETEYQRKERIADQERERRARTRGDFFKPMNWTPEERVRLNAWRRHDAPVTERGGYAIHHITPYSR